MDKRPRGRSISNVMRAPDTLAGKKGIDRREFMRGTGSAAVMLASPELLQNFFLRNLKDICDDKAMTRLDELRALQRYAFFTIIHAWHTYEEGQNFEYGGGTLSAVIPENRRGPAWDETKRHIFTGRHVLSRNPNSPKPDDDMELVHPDGRLIKEYRAFYYDEAEGIPDTAVLEISAEEVKDQRGIRTLSSEEALPPGTEIFLLETNLVGERKRHQPQGRILATTITEWDHDATWEGKHYQFKGTQILTSDSLGKGSSGGSAIAEDDQEWIQIATLSSEISDPVSKEILGAGMYPLTYHEQLLIREGIMTEK